MIVAAAMKSGFSGGLVVDYPNSTRAKKYFLCLFAGASAQLPQGLDGTEAEATTGVKYSGDRIRTRTKVGKKVKRDKEWVQKKKELNRTRGVPTPADSKYTARKRKVRF
jgi:18S rRNA (guanine1575-N7)-methyltransferase